MQWSDGSRYLHNVDHLVVSKPRDLIHWFHCFNPNTLFWIFMIYKDRNASSNVAFYLYNYVCTTSFAVYIAVQQQRHVLFTNTPQPDFILRIFQPNHHLFIPILYQHHTFCPVSFIAWYNLIKSTRGIFHWYRLYINIRMDKWLHQHKTACIWLITHPCPDANCGFVQTPLDE